MLLLRRRTECFISVAALMLLAAACSGGGEPAGSRPTTPDSLTAVPSVGAAPLTATATELPGTAAPADTENARPTSTVAPAVAARPGLARVLQVLTDPNRTLAARAAELAGLAPIPCDPNGMSGPPCDGRPARTPMSAFLVPGCPAGFATTPDEARTELLHEFELHAAWVVNGAADAGPGDPPSAAYVVEDRAATGNNGDLLYVSADGHIVGINDACQGRLADGLIAPDRYLFGPLFRGDSTPTLGAPP